MGWVLETLTLALRRMIQLGSWWFITLLMLIHFSLIKSKTGKRSFSKDKDYVKTWTCIKKELFRFDVINFSVSELIDNAIICFRAYQEGLNYKLEYFNRYIFIDERKYAFIIYRKLYHTLVPEGEIKLPPGASPRWRIGRRYCSLA